MSKANMHESARRKASGLVEPPIPADYISYRIRLIQIAAFKHFEAMMIGFGSAPRYFGMLCLIEANPGITQTKLANAIFLTRASLVPILETMEREGVVVRTGAPSDKRLRCVSLTERGLQLVAELKPHVAQHEAMMVAGLSEAERDTLFRLLRRVEENIAKSASSGRALTGARKP